MRKTQTKKIRKVLGLPRCPKSMDKSSRWYYRQIKRRFKNLPSGVTCEQFLGQVIIASRAAKVKAVQ